VTRFQRTLCCALGILSSVSAFAAEPQIKRRLTPEDYAYTLAEGVTRREITYYSDDVACFAVLFLPKGFAPNSSVPGIVLAQGWAGTHESIEKYGERFAEHGFAAMVIDYRGWGKSNGFATLAAKSLQARPRNDDSRRYMRGEFPIEIRRTRLVPAKQVEDIRNAISYLQGEPGVDRDRIGVWGAGFAGGNAIVVAAMDARVKAMALQTPSIAGKNAPAAPLAMNDRMLEDAIRRARTGQGAEMDTTYPQRRKIDYETNQLVAEFRPFHQLEHIGDRPVLFVVAENDELFDNDEHALAAARVLTGPARVLEIPHATHFDLYVGAAFDVSANAAAGWFKEHLKK
jgi:dienelactone hydrolase